MPARRDPPDDSPPRDEDAGGRRLERRRRPGPAPEPRDLLGPRPARAISTRTTRWPTSRACSRTRRRRSARGTSAQRAWEDGAGPRPSRRATTIAPNPGCAQGVVAVVIAPALTREAVFDALAERRTYATTGARIVLDFSVGGVPMGGRRRAGGRDGRRAGDRGLGRRHSGHRPRRGAASRGRATRLPRPGTAPPGERPRRLGVRATTRTTRARSTTCACDSAALSMAGSRWPGPRQSGLSRCRRVARPGVAGRPGRLPGAGQPGSTPQALDRRSPPRRRGGADVDRHRAADRGTPRPPRCAGPARAGAPTTRTAAG